MDGDDELFKETETLLEEGQFRVMKDDNRSLYWEDTVVYNGKKILPVNIKRERGMGDSDDEVKTEEPIRDYISILYSIAGHHLFPVNT